MKYFAVVTTATFNRPVFSPFSSASCISSRSNAPVTFSTAARTSAPASVMWIFLPICSYSGMPMASASCLTCSDTVGCARCSSFAARLKPDNRATVSNTFSWRRVSRLTGRLFVIYL